VIFSARGTSTLLAWTRVPVPCKTLNSPQRGQVHYTDAAAGASNDRGRFISSSFVFLKQLKRAGVPHAQLLHFYLAVIRPVLEYAAPVWHHSLNKSQRSRLKQYKQELSYRKQIARQLRTQFVEGISVTLKSTLRVTQGHWKRNHWTDHTRLTVRRVIGR